MSQMKTYRPKTCSGQKKKMQNVEQGRKTGCLHTCFQNHFFSGAKENRGWRALKSKIQAVKLQCLVSAWDPRAITHPFRRDKCCWWLSYKKELIFHFFEGKIIAAPGSPFYCYYIFVKVCHLKCASIIIHNANDSLLPQISDGLPPVDVRERV